MGPEERMVVWIVGLSVGVPLLAIVLVTILGK